MKPRNFSEMGLKETSSFELLKNELQSDKQRLLLDTLIEELTIEVNRYSYSNHVGNKVGSNIIWIQHTKLRLLGSKIWDQFGTEFYSKTFSRSIFRILSQIPEWGKIIFTNYRDLVVATDLDEQEFRTSVINRAIQELANQLCRFQKPPTRYLNWNVFIERGINVGRSNNLTGAFLDMKFRMLDIYFDSWWSEFLETRKKLINLVNENNITWDEILIVARHAHSNFNFIIQWVSNHGFQANLCWDIKRYGDYLSIFDFFPLPDFAEQFNVKEIQKLLSDLKSCTSDSKQQPLFKVQNLVSNHWNVQRQEFLSNLPDAKVITATDFKGLGVENRKAIEKFANDLSSVESKAAYEDIQKQLPFLLTTQTKTLESVHQAVHHEFSDIANNLGQSYGYRIGDDSLFAVTSKEAKTIEFTKLIHCLNQFSKQLYCIATTLGQHFKVEDKIRALVWLRRELSLNKKNVGNQIMRHFEVTNHLTPCEIIFSELMLKLKRNELKVDDLIATAQEIDVGMYNHLTTHQQTPAVAGVLSFAILHEILNQYDNLPQDILKFRNMIKLVLQEISEAKQNQTDIQNIKDKVNTLFCYNGDFKRQYISQKMSEDVISEIIKSTHSLRSEQINKFKGTVVYRCKDGRFYLRVDRKLVECAHKKLGGELPSDQAGIGHIPLSCGMTKTTTYQIFQKIAHSTTELINKSCDGICDLKIDIEFSLDRVYLGYPKTASRKQLLTAIEIKSEGLQRMAAEFGLYPRYSDSEIVFHLPVAEQPREEHWEFGQRVGNVLHFLEKETPRAYEVYSSIFPTSPKMKANTISPKSQRDDRSLFKSKL